MSIREYNGWHEESITEHFGFSGNTSDCDYAGSQVTLSVLDESGSWVESPDFLATGNNQIRLNVGDISLPENYSYYIQSQIDGSGVTSVSTHRYFNIGTPSYYGYSANEYDGGDIYYNFTVAEWTCTASAYLRIYIISSDGAGTRRHDADQILPEQRLRAYWEPPVQIRGRGLGAWPPERLGDSGRDHGSLLEHDEPEHRGEVQAFVLRLRRRPNLLPPQFGKYMVRRFGERVLALRFRYRL